MASLALLAGGDARAAPAWNLIGSAGAGHDSNTGNADAPADIRSSAFADAMLGLQGTFAAGEASQLQLRALVADEQWRDVPGLSNARATVSLRLAHKAGVEFYAPVLTIGAAVDFARFESSARDSYGTRLSGAILEPLTTQLTGRLIVTASHRHADNAVFDVHSAGIGGHLDWSALPRLVLTAGYDFLNGDLVATEPRDPAAAADAAARMIDDAFVGILPDPVAYRLEAHSDVFTAGGNFALSHNLSLDAQWRYFDVHAVGDRHYRRWVGEASLLARF